MVYLTSFRYFHRKLSQSSCSSYTLGWPKLSSSYIFSLVMWCTHTLLFPCALITTDLKTPFQEYAVLALGQTVNRCYPSSTSWALLFWKKDPQDVSLLFWKSLIFKLEVKLHALKLHINEIRYWQYFLQNY